MSKMVAVEAKLADQPITGFVDAVEVGYGLHDGLIDNLGLWNPHSAQ